MKKLLKVYSIHDGNPWTGKGSPEISCINDYNPHRWVELCFGVSFEESQNAKLGDEYIVKLRKRRWYYFLLMHSN